MWRECAQTRDDFLSDSEHLFAWLRWEAHLDPVFKHRTKRLRCASLLWASHRFYNNLPLNELQWLMKNSLTLVLLSLDWHPCGDKLSSRYVSDEMLHALSHHCKMKCSPFFLFSLFIHYLLPPFHLCGAQSPANRRVSTTAAPLPCFCAPPPLWWTGTGACWYMESTQTFFKCMLQDSKALKYVCMYAVAKTYCSHMSFVSLQHGLGHI